MRTCQVGQRPSDRKAKRVLGMHADGLSYRRPQHGHGQEHCDEHCLAERRAMTKGDRLRSFEVAGQGQTRPQTGAKTKRGSVPAQRCV
jgi:hypothetical protein